MRERGTWHRAAVSRRGGASGTSMQPPSAIALDLLSPCLYVPVSFQSAKRGVSRPSRTLDWNAMDAAVSRDERMTADGKGVWSWPPDAGVKSCGLRCRPPRARHDEFCETTEAIKPGTPGRARYRPLKPLRRECRIVWLTCGDDSRVFELHARLRVRPSTRHSLRPRFPRDENDFIVRTRPRRGNAPLRPARIPSG